MRDPKFNNTVYGAVSTTVATGQTNNDINANNPTLFANINASNITKITTDQTITLRFNSTSMPGIVMTATESPKTFDALLVKNIYVTNASGSTANLKIEVYS